MRYLVTATFLLLGQSTALMAATTPAPVLDESNPVFKPYLSDASEPAACATQGGGGCQMAFPAVTFERVLVAHVSCLFELPSDGTISYVILYNTGAQTLQPLQPFAYSTANGFTYYGIDAVSYMIIQRGAQPEVLLVTNVGSVLGLECHLTGYEN